MIQIIIIKELELEIIGNYLSFIQSDGCGNDFDETIPSDTDFFTDFQILFIQVVKNFPKDIITQKVYVVYEYPCCQQFIFSAIKKK